MGKEWGEGSEETKATEDPTHVNRGVRTQLFTASRKASVSRSWDVATWGQGAKCATCLHKIRIPVVLQAKS